jgi:hypothetical protein
MPFWKMIKQGYDHFEVTRQEPKVEFCENKYVFDPAQPPNSSRPLAFNASAKCPVYVIPDEIADAVREKQHQDEIETSRLIAKGTPVARLNTGIDGGMNRVFAAKLPDGNTGLSEGGDSQGLSLVALSRAPGTIPSHVNPPRPSDALLRGGSEEPVVAVTSGAPVTRVALAASPSQSDGFFSSLARKVGLSGSDATSATKERAATKPKAVDALRPSASLPRSNSPKSGDSKVAVRPPLKPSLPAADQTAAASPAPTAMAGATPGVTANSFESRFSAVK